MSKRDARTLQDYIAFAHELADAAANEVLPYFRAEIVVDNKAGAGSFDPVTEADLAAERAMADLIRERFPEHGLLGEEYGLVNARARLRWVLDPIDGTRAFIMGSPLWGTLIGLLEGEHPILGLMDQPFTGERYWSDGRATYYRRGRDGPHQKLSTRACPKLASAVLSTTHPDLFAEGEELGAFLRLKAQARLTRYGGDCYAYCLLAAGHIDLVVEAGLAAHDIVALVPIIEGAGGHVATWDGGPATAGGRIIASGDPALLEAAVRVLNNR